MIVEIQWQKLKKEKRLKNRHFTCDEDEVPYLPLTFRLDIVHTCPTFRLKVRVIVRVSVRVRVRVRVRVSPTFRL